jgi:hypothetical protein
MKYENLVLTKGIIKYMLEKIKQLYEEIQKYPFLNNFRIDVMIYKLYELSYEEVKVVDSDFWMNKEEYEQFNLAKI